MATFDLSGFTLQTKDIDSLKKLIYEQIVRDSRVPQLHSMYTGIRVDEYLGSIGEFGLVGKAAQGCSPTADTSTFSGTRKKWEPKKWEVILDVCADDLEGTIAQYAVKNGIDRHDLSSTDYAEIIFERLAAAADDMAWRLAWFSDTAAANNDDSPAGTITSGVDTSYFSLNDGIFKQLATIYGTTTARKTSITKNAQTTYANQALTDQECFEYLEAVYKAAPSALKMASNGQMFTTGKIAEGYRRHMTKTYGPYIDGFKGITNGISEVSYNGLPVYGLWIWDKIIEANYDYGTYWYQPNRIVYTTKDNLAIGVEETSELTKMELSFDKRTRYNRFEMAGRIDVKIIQDNLVQVGI